MRLDLWLDIACLFKTRSEAQKACKNGKIDVNGQPAKPHRDIKAGDEIVIHRPLGRRQRLLVVAIAEKHLPKAEARELYKDLTPPPTPEELEARKMARLTGRSRADGTPGRLTSASDASFDDSKKETDQSLASPAPMRTRSVSNPARRPNLNIVGQIALFT